MDQVIQTQTKNKFNNILKGALHPPTPKQAQLV
jgi:hypothetical protein